MTHESKIAEGMKGNVMRALVTQEALWKLMEDLEVLLKGHFVLTSGRHGREYANKDVLFRYPGAMDFLASIIAFHFRSNDVYVVAGPTVGAVALVQRTAQHLQLLTGRPVEAVFVDEGPEKSRIIKRGFDQVVKGQRVLMVEDVLTTSGSAKKSVGAVTDAGGSVMGVAALVNRRPENNTAESLGVPELFSLVEHEFDDWEESACPLCRDGVDITLSPGKGREYLAAKEAKE